MKVIVIEENKFIISQITFS